MYPEELRILLTDVRNATAEVFVMTSETAENISHEKFVSTDKCIALSNKLINLAECESRFLTELSRKSKAKILTFNDAEEAIFQIEEICKFEKNIAKLKTIVCISRKYSEVLNLLIEDVEKIKGDYPQNSSCLEVKISEALLKDISESSYKNLLSIPEFEESKYSLLLFACLKNAFVFPENDEELKKKILIEEVQQETVIKDSTVEEVQQETVIENSIVEETQQNTVAEDVQVATLIEEVQQETSSEELQVETLIEEVPVEKPKDEDEKLRKETPVIEDNSGENNYFFRQDKEELLSDTSLELEENNEILSVSETEVSDEYIESLNSRLIGYNGNDELSIDSMASANRVFSMNDAMEFIFGSNRNGKKTPDPYYRLIIDSICVRGFAGVDSLVNDSDESCPEYIEKLYNKGYIMKCTLGDSVPLYTFTENGISIMKNFKILKHFYGKIQFSGSKLSVCADDFYISLIAEKVYSEINGSDFEKMRYYPLKSGLRFFCKVKKDNSKYAVWVVTSQIQNTIKCANEFKNDIGQESVKIVVASETLDMADEVCRVVMDIMGEDSSYIIYGFEEDEFIDCSTGEDWSFAYSESVTEELIDYSDSKLDRIQSDYFNDIDDYVINDENQNAGFYEYNKGKVSVEDAVNTAVDNILKGNSRMAVEYLEECAENNEELSAYSEYLMFAYNYPRADCRYNSNAILDIMNVNDYSEYEVFRFINASATIRNFYSNECEYDCSMNLLYNTINLDEISEVKKIAEIFMNFKEEFNKGVEIFTDYAVNQQEDIKNTISQISQRAYVLHQQFIKTPFPEKTKITRYKTAVEMIFSTRGDIAECLGIASENNRQNCEIAGAFVSGFMRSNRSIGKNNIDSSAIEKYIDNIWLECCENEVIYNTINIMPSFRRGLYKKIESCIGVIAEWYRWNSYILPVENPLTPQLHDEITENLDLAISQCKTYQYEDKMIKAGMMCLETALSEIRSRFSDNSNVKNSNNSVFTQYEKLVSSKKQKDFSKIYEQCLPEM